MDQPKYYLFDMDHTLIQADCDVTWKYFAVKHKLAPESALAEADRFFEDYNAGCLDVEACYEFQFREFAGKTIEEMAELSRLHFEEFIKEHIYADAVAAVNSARASGHPVGILSSTNGVLVKPVADFFGISHIYGTTLEVAGGRYTGRITGVYGAGNGKVEIAAGLLKAAGVPFEKLAYYGDSINDRYILAASGFPRAVNPSDSLRHLAAERGWPILMWK